MIRPQGWKVLIKPRPKVEKTQGGILLAEETQRNQEILARVGQVIDMGPLCYRKEEHGEPWCRVGDWVLFDKHAGIPVMTAHDERYLLLSDDQILAVVPEPDEIKREF